MTESVVREVQTGQLTELLHHGPNMVELVVGQTGTVAEALAVVVELAELSVAAEG